VTVVGAVPLVEFPFSGNGLTAAVTTRNGGVSRGPFESLNLGDHVGDDHDAVVENRRRLCEVLGVDRLTVADQQHGSTVAVIDAALAGRGHDGATDARAALPATDAMVTGLTGVALSVVVGDCAPVVLYDPVRRATGVAHCGRPGIVAGVLPAAIETMTEQYGSRPPDLLVGIGPCVAAPSYEVGPAEVAAVTAAFRGGDLLTTTRAGHATFDLVGALRLQLAAAGVRPGSVATMDIDTRTSTDQYFSDRAVRPCGRFMAVIVMR
jgi:hypothetical protein